MAATPVTNIFDSTRDTTEGIEVGPRLDPAVRLDAGPADIAELKRLLRRGARVAHEQFDEDTHLDEVIPKPWGYEYRAFVDEFFDFWALHIDAPHSTSVHVHPRKLTYLLCLGGQGVTTGLGGVSIPIRQGSVVRIAPGAFHGTRNAGDEPLELIEVESPRNKFDLMRLKDDYNRAGTAYESTSLETPRHPMRKVVAFPNTRMRARTPDGRFRFELRTGMDLFYRRRDEDLFHIPLCVSGAVYADVEILTGRPEDTRRVQADKQYLCVSRA
ncbi:cupin domain-containing protein [Streptomyces sp. NPDC101062]|uniref:cupin domain-containing protein n=1 Tax=unclassified Streptomyces TaxID=2593676 RepID=UPI002E76CD9F|nr:cupin domain-containing protein [Streptomyces sp. JV176]MEE1799910.1 cupin domain-containing protein [Streptomyces sp. JV176]